MNLEKTEAIDVQIVNNKQVNSFVVLDGTMYEDGVKNYRRRYRLKQQHGGG